MEAITPKQIARLRKKMGLNQREFSEEIGVSHARLALGSWVRATPEEPTVRASWLSMWNTFPHGKRTLEAANVAAVTWCR